MAGAAMFAGLVADEQGREAEVAWVGPDACYVVDDDGFRRHIDAAEVARQVLRYLREQIEPHRELAVRAMLQLMGKDDIFSKTAVEYSLKRMEEAVGTPLPPAARELLRAHGFRIIINVHGEVLAVEMGEPPLPDGE